MRVESAFLFGIFPPPAPCPGVFAWLYGPRAGGAANADKAFVVQFVVRDRVFLQVAGHLFIAPVDERVVFVNPEISVPFPDRDRTSVVGLFGTQARDPDLLAGQRPS